MQKIYLKSSLGVVTCQVVPKEVRMLMIFLGTLAVQAPGVSIKMSCLISWLKRTCGWGAQSFFKACWDQVLLPHLMI
jgi:hypothetical protein